MTTWNERVSLAKYAPNSVLMQQETGNAEGSSTDEWNLNSSHAGNLKSKPDETADDAPDDTTRCVATSATVRHRVYENSWRHKAP